MDIPSTPQNGVIRRLLVIILSLLLALVVTLLIVVPQFMRSQAVRYGAAIVLPEKAEYCPGETLRFTYTLRMERPGPVEIIQAWCKQSNGSCLLRESTIYYGIITARHQTRDVTISRPIPISPLLVIGEVWEYAQSARSLDGGPAETFSVPFKIKDCRKDKKTTPSPD